MGVIRTCGYGVAAALVFVSSVFAQTVSGPWRSIGPDGGSIFAIVSDPVYPNIVHVATDGGGVFRSTDNGTTWRPASGVPAGVTRALVIAPSDHSVLYAGTRNHGIFASTDGGATWSAVAAPGRHVFDAALPPEITALAVDPHDAHVVYASIGGNAALLYKSTNGGHAWSAVGTLAPSSDMPRADGIRIDPAAPGTMYLFGSRVMLKTVDAGQTWAPIGPIFPEFLEPHDLQIDPHDPAVLYASLGPRGIYKSGDRGASWAAANTGIPAGSAASDVTLAGLAIDGRDGTLLAAALCRPFAPSCAEGAVFKSVNGATTWTPAHVGRGGWNSAVVAVTRSTPATLFDGSRCEDVSPAPGPNGTTNLQCGGTLFRSTSGGSTWDDAFVGIRSQAAIAVDADPSDPTVLVTTTRRGIFRSADGGATWSNRPLALTGAKSLATAPGARQMYAVVDEGTGDFVYASNDHGLTWVFTTSTGLGDPDSLLLVLDLAVTPFTAIADRLYAATFSGLFTSVDSGINWTKLSGTFISTLVEVRPDNPSVVFYTLSATPQSSETTQLYRSTDGGTSATPVALAGNVRAIAFDPSNPDTMYAALLPDTSCFSANQVFKSIDGGTTWTSASAGLPTTTSCDSQGNGVVVDPANPSRVFAGTHKGVFVTLDAGAHWAAWPGPQDKSISSLAIAGSKLIAVATAFGGLFIDDLTCPITTSPAAQTISAAGGQSTVVVSAPAGCAWSAASDASFVSTSAAGTGNGTAVITVEPNPAAPRSATVSVAGTTVTIDQRATEMTLDRASLQFAATNSGVAFVAKTSAQEVRLVQAGPGSVTWTAVSDQPWLTVSSPGGTGTASLNVDVAHTPGMPLSTTLSGSIVVSFGGIPQPAVTIPVTLTVVPNGSSAAPVGSFDTPVNGISGVAGSVPVTGWALDDVGVSRVRIMRDPVAPEPADALVFIGDAIFIDGARPDLTTAFAATPRNTRAGWGYLLLTNFLPNTGNGTFRLHAIAEDVDGHSTELGTKTITVDNANATKPFGAIDTPRQGEAVCGTIINFGWTLTQDPKDVAADSSTVRVFIDGVVVGQPGSRSPRTDITSLFPGYDTTHPVGGFVLDTTPFSNGVHTIFWVVSDSGAKTDGIGSRFFTVSNPCGASLAADRGGASLRAATITQEVDRAPIDPSPILGRRGYDLDAPLTEYTRDRGRITVHAEELDRIELRLRQASGEYSGYLGTATGLMPLPAGSTLDADAAMFAWMPGPGFVGAYDLVFVRWSGGRAVARQDVRILLHAKGSNRVGPQVLVDVPSPDARAAGAAFVGRTFFLGGWAADLDSGIDRGVDTVHVWAYPVNDRGEREAPSFVGVAEYGGARPDVAAVYGDRFRATGYGLIGRLESGVYDLAVFAFSTVRGNFAPAKVVRVIVR